MPESEDLLSREFEAVFEEYKSGCDEAVTPETFRELLDKLTNPASLGHAFLNVTRARYGLPKLDPGQASGHKATEYYKKKLRRFLDEDGNLSTKAIRQTLDMSQDEFSRTFSIPINTVCSWDQEVYKPKGPNLVALAMIALEPELAKRAATIFREVRNEISNKK